MDHAFGHQWAMGVVPVMRSKEKFNRSEQPKSEEATPDYGESQTAGQRRDWQHKPTTWGTLLADDWLPPGQGKFTTRLYCSVPGSRALISQV